MSGWHRVEVRPAPLLLVGHRASAGRAPRSVRRWRPSWRGPSLLTPSDVYGTGYHAAVKTSVSPRTTVTVIGDGAVGLLAVKVAKRLGAERIILMGRHTARTDLGRQFPVGHTCPPTSSPPAWSAQVA